MPPEGSRPTATDVLQYSAPTEGARSRRRAGAHRPNERGAGARAAETGFRGPHPRAGYLCPLSANRYNVRFNAFKVRDYDANTTLYEVRAPPSDEDEQQPFPHDPTPEEEAQIRSISYQFPARVLSLKRIGTTCARSQAAQARLMLRG